MHLKALDHRSGTQKIKCRDIALKTVSQKMGLKEGVCTFFLNALDSALGAIKLRELNASQTLREACDFLHLSNPFGSGAKLVGWRSAINDIPVR